MRRLVSACVLLAMLVLAGAPFLRADAAGMATYGYLEYTYSGYTASITDCNHKAVGFMSVPSMIGDKTVVTIQEYAFQNCTWLNGFYVPDTVTTIGRGAFMSCTNAVNITLPAGLTSISESMFWGCSSLKEITIGDQVMQIKNYAFSGCSNLTEVIIPHGVTTIGAEVFASCSSLETVVIPNTVTSIGSDVFYECNNLRKIIYCGTEAQWNKVYVKGSNTVLKATEVQYHLMENGSCSFCDTPMSGYVTLTDDMTLSNLRLTEDLHVDLNGFDLSGVIMLNGHKVYGMDSTTDEYACENIGFFNCVDENGNAIIPERLYTAADAKRYMTVETESGYSFHRFYLGITNLSLRPANVAFGYKAEYYGDDMVQAQIEAVGYRLWLTEDRTLERTTGFRNSVTLRLNHFDVDHYGEVPVNACATILLKDGTLLESASAHYSMRQMVERLNASYTGLTADQLTAIENMIEKHAPMQDWSVDNLFKKA